MKVCVHMFCGLMLCFAGAVQALAAECRQEIRFEKGAISSEVSGQIAAYDYCDYLVRANKGQLLAVWNSSEKSNTVLQGPLEAMLIDGEAVELPKNGLYTLRVLMPRALARKGQQDTFTLKVQIVTPGVLSQHASAVASPADGHGARESLDWPGYYHGIVPCASCPGIDTWLHLEEQKDRVHYQLTEKYLAEKDSTFQSQNTAVWQENNSSILLLQGADENRRLFVREGSVFFLGMDQLQPEEDSAYRLEKMDVFSGHQEHLFVAPSQVRRATTKQDGEIVNLEDVLINFEQPTEAGHTSLQANLTLYCEDDAYAMPIITYYEKSFASGNIINKAVQKDADKLPFTDQDDIMAQAARSYCQ